MGTKTTKVTIVREIRAKILIVRKNTSENNKSANENASEQKNENESKQNESRSNNKVSFKEYTYLGNPILLQLG